MNSKKLFVILLFVCTCPVLYSMERCALLFGDRIIHEVSFENVPSENKLSYMEKLNQEYEKTLKELGIEEASCLEEEASCLEEEASCLFVISERDRNAIHLRFNDLRLDAEMKFCEGVCDFMERQKAGASK